MSVKRCSYKDTLKNDAYLTVMMRKSLGKVDADGNYEFEVEASNENLDLQGQKVLQSALLESKDSFLKHGVISCDHLHRRHDDEGNVISDPGMVIGEPTDVYTDGKSTIVKGKLYGNNETARKFIDLLKAHSTRVSASVGGVMPVVTKDPKTGVEKIRHVYWNDLALTTSPVNGTVGSAKFAKALNSAQFAKALTAGYGTDSAAFTGGRALIPENVGGVMTLDPNVLRDLKAAISGGQLQNIKGVMTFLMSQGINKNDALNYVKYAIKHGRRMKEKKEDRKVKSMEEERRNPTKAQMFAAFLRDRMDRADVRAKELSYRTGIPEQTVRKYRQTKAVMPTLYNGLLMLEALGSKHAKALMEIWRSWYGEHCGYLDEVSE